MSANTIKTLRRGTLFLAFLSSVQLLLIRNTAVECDSRDHLTERTAQLEEEDWRNQQPVHLEERQARSQQSSKHPAVASGYRNGDVSEVVRRFLKTSKYQLPLQPSCSQAYTNATNQASILAVGNLELTSSPQQTHLLALTARSLPQVDWIISTIVTPLPWKQSPAAITQALKSLRDSGVQLVSLATERMYSDEEGAVKTTTQYLEEAGIHWVGLALKKDEVVVLNGIRVGFLAFCAVYKACTESSDGKNKHPFTPIKYTAKAAAKAVTALRVRGIDVIVVKMRWGRSESYYPDETALVAARYLASLGVTLIIGDHPILQQDHAYFQNTLVIFSTGSFSRPSNGSRFCWQQSSQRSMEYSEHDHCRSVHPGLRSSFRTSEHHTSFYRIQLSRGSAVVADYASVPLSDQDGSVEAPDPASLGELEWTRVCGGEDRHCLACDSL